MRYQVSIVIPVYNERDCVGPLMHEIVSVMEPLKRSYEVIFVDDGSTDGSREVLEQICAEHQNGKALFFRRNAGQTAALDAGFRKAQGDAIVTLDADGQNDPADIPMMLKRLEEGYDCVTGWRKDRQDSMWPRKIPSLAANKLIRTLWKSELHDLGCSLKVYRREVVSELRLYGEMHRFIGLLLEGMGAKLTEVVVNHRPRRAGTSKYGLSRVFKVLMDMMTIWFLQSYRTKPLYVFGTLAVGCFSVSLISLAEVTWEKIFLATSVHRNPLFTLAVFTTVLAVQFVALGLLAELLIRNYFESSQRFPYSLEREIGFKDSRQGLAA